MRRTMTLALTGAGVLLAVPVVAAADRMMVDHGHGPDAVHDTAYSAVTTQVHSWSKDDSTRVRLMAEGLPPNRTFGAHVHTGLCGTDPLASGGHYQHPGHTGTLEQREVWLDITTDADGRGVATRTVGWEFAPGTAGSVVIHANPTNPTNGGAGARLACTTVAFGE
ncbi:superoxide dismutase [Nocardioides gansuensis]|uniref:Superoxide dismutase [Cu-Zn] n=1 Tax=Nocardioides gansuensis TaxID=2138300 RepID=A0A2T8FF28_9ACTN|nr:superoxide dismutase family protein [Nocardioides gansuensis]PVG84297.1 superoxide dismutase [Nocardioides gansuensis]